MDMKKDSFTVVDDDAVDLFTNMISFNVNPEEVCIGIGIRNPQHTDVIRVHTYLHLTIPHFLRLAEAVNQQVSTLIDKGVLSREPEQ